MTSKKYAAPEPEPEPEAAPVARAVADDDDDTPGLTEAEYLERRRDLEAKLLALEARYRARQRWPRWAYHPSLAARTVATRAALQALGAGWQVTPVEAAP